MQDKWWIGIWVGAQERAVKEGDVLGVWFRRIDGTVLRQRC